MTELKRYSCITCGAPLKEQDGKFVCPNCKNEFHLEEKISEEEVVSLNRATTDRNLLRFDDAFEEYELLLKKYPKNEMANWGAFLSFYGIVYEKDVDGTYVPTCHRLSEKPVESSKYYRYFNTEHIARAKEVEKLRESIMQKAQRIPPYDVFICYKATEERFGRPYPTKEASWARDVYEMLTHELKLRVFFAEKSLGNSNEEYEPHIYSALNSAKLMLVMTTGMDNVNAVWVKNEWKRYSKYIQEGKAKTIRVVYDNIEPYDLPLELQKTQAINHNDIDWGKKVKKAAEAIFVDPLEEERKKKAAEEAARKEREAAAARERAREEELQKMRETMEALQKQANAPKPAPIPATPAPTPKSTVAAPVRRGEPADKYCVKCGSGNVKNAKFCAECAHNVFTPEFKQYCLDCGTEMELLKKFCPNCAKNRFVYDKDAYLKEVERRKLASFQIENGVLKNYKGNDKKIIIPNSVKSISYYALKACPDLTSITIPDSVTSIDNYAFSDCSKLLGITVDENNKAYKSVNGNLYSKDGTTLVQYAVGRTDTSFTVPDGVKSIGGGAFKGCHSLTSITIPNSVTSIGEEVFKGCNNLKQAKCPAIVCKHLPKISLQTVTVTDGSIEEKAFDGCGDLTSVTLLGGVTSIGDYAFSGCGGLTSINIPNSVTNIDKGAFYNCGGLTSITIPDSVTSIGENAFYNCRSLTSVIIPDSVTSIGKCAFETCRSLTSITVDEKNTAYKSIDGNLYSKDGRTLVQYAIGKKATSFTVPDVVTSIDDAAFANCENLTGITIPDSVTSIGEGAFRDCTGLTGVNIPDGVTSIANGTFNGCENLENINVPDGVTSIGDAAFFGCENLENINVPDGVTSIGFNAFCRCSRLTSITLPDSVVSIGFSAFGSCRSLTSITISDGVTSVNSQTFYGCSSLTSITIPDSVTRIGESAFANCENLTCITIPDSVTYIAEDAFNGCDNLKHAECPMFAYKYVSKSLQTITITGGAIEANAFENCGNLTSITILDGVTSIAGAAFKGCSSLTSITIPNSITKIGRYAFSGCGSLKYAECPAIVCKHLPKKSLQTVTITGGSIEAKAFENCGNLTSVTLLDGVTCISNCTFLDCVNLKSITIPDSVTIIGGGAFNGCTGLTSITIPDGVTSIGDYAFSRCGGLTSINIPNSVTNIDKGAFYNCSSLTSITIPDSVTSIGEEAFYNCSSLTSITIPDSITSIGKDAFFHCNSLTIYALAKKKPQAWYEKRGFLGIGIKESWNPDKRPVVWGYKGK